MRAAPVLQGSCDEQHDEDDEQYEKDRAEFHAGCCTRNYQGFQRMHLELRRALSSVGFAYADLMLEVARFELEDSLSQASTVARKADRLETELRQVKDGLKAHLKAGAA